MRAPRKPRAQDGLTAARAPSPGPAARPPATRPPATRPPATRPNVDAAVSAVVSDLPAISANTEEIRSYLSYTVSAALEQRGVSAGDLRAPRMDVMIPAIEALRYSDIRAAFATLIASSMDTRVAHTILPAYVEILKQLSADELALLRALPAPGRFNPIADVVFILPNEQIVSAYRNVLLSDLADRCLTPSNIPQYVDNLARLNLIYRPAGQQAADIAYRPLTRLAFVRALMNKAPDKSRAGIDKAVFGLSDLGESFRQACLPWE